MVRVSSTGKKLIICLCLALATGAVFGIAVTYDFINYDDPDYVTENHHVQAGLSMTGVVWAFTTTIQDHWHPVTMLSHMLDCQLFGLNPAGHHFTNILFHIVNTILLFVLLHRMTKALWPSALVAALFALHPLHIESVVWIAERKDVLSTFFMLMTLWAYVSYTEHSGLKSYFLALSLFALGLMSKSMVVTLPFLLLLLDFWPLGRLSFFSDMKRQGPSSPVPTHKILWEKAPFFLLSIIVSIVTLLAHQDRLTDTTRLLYPFSDRVIRTVDGYTFYVWKMFFPIDLSIPYQLDNPAFNWQSLLSLVFLAGLSILCLKYIKKRPYLMVGWVWYLVTLAPVSGIIQTGPTILADRYVYIPLIGLFIMLSWGLREIIDRGWRVKRAAAAMMVLIMVIYSLLSVKQLRYWKDSVTLFSQAIAVNPNNNLARENLGIALYEDDKLPEAEWHLKEVVRQSREKSTAYLYLALIASSKEQDATTISYLRNAIEANPRNAEAHVNLGIALAGKEEYTKADEAFSKALKIEPDLVKAHYNYAASLYLQHRDKEAMEELTKTLEIDPNFKQARDLLNSIQMANNE